MAPKKKKFMKFTNHKGEIGVFNVFIIHGHSKEINELNEFIQNSLNFATTVSMNEFKGGHILTKIKETAWHKCDCAVALLSPDNQLSDGKIEARQNVIFEIGYCMGFWDYYYWEDDDLYAVIIIKEKSVTLPSDLIGLEIIEYERGALSVVLPKIGSSLTSIYKYVDNG